MEHVVQTPNSWEVVGTVYTIKGITWCACTVGGLTVDVISFCLFFIFEIYCIACVGLSLFL